VGALVGAVYGHMSAVADGCPLLGLMGVPRGVLTGAVTTSGVFLSSGSWPSRRWAGCAACRSWRTWQ
jgi:hypothetical protein